MLLHAATSPSNAASTTCSSPAAETRVPVHSSKHRYLERRKFGTVVRDCTFASARSLHLPSPLLPCRIVQRRVAPLRCCALLSPLLPTAPTPSASSTLAPPLLSPRRRRRAGIAVSYVGRRGGHCAPLPPGAPPALALRSRYHFNTKLGHDSGVAAAVLKRAQTLSSGDCYALRLAFVRGEHVLARF